VEWCGLPLPLTTQSAAAPATALGKDDKERTHERHQLTVTKEPLFIVATLLDLQYCSKVLPDDELDDTIKCLIEPMASVMMLRLITSALKTDDVLQSYVMWHYLSALSTSVATAVQGNSRPKRHF